MEIIWFLVFSWLKSGKWRPIAGLFQMVSMVSMVMWLLSHITSDEKTLWLSDPATLKIPLIVNGCRKLGPILSDLKTCAFNELMCPQFWQTGQHFTNWIWIWKIILSILVNVCWLESVPWSIWYCETYRSYAREKFNISCAYWYIWNMRIILSVYRTDVRYQYL